MQTASRLSYVLVSLLAATLIAGCAHSPPSDPWDPLEPVNRASFTFTMKADHYVIKPLAQGYNKVTPEPVQTSIGNFFDNARQPITMINSLLQLKWGRFNQSLGRFMINTTAGLGGLFDVATKLGVPHPQEDFGQTFGYWGVGPGAYLYIPILGPSDGRDALGGVADQFAYPINYLNTFDEIDDHYSWLPYALRGLEALNRRAELLGFEETLKQQFDPYAFVRSYYLENRLKAVHDGSVPEQLQSDEDDFGDDSALPEPAAGEQ